MSIAHHHTEWLSLLEVSGPFLTMPVLTRYFPQGLEVVHEPEVSRNLRLAYEEWSDNQQGLRPETAIHFQWLRFVLRTLLTMPEEALAEGQALPPGLQVLSPDHSEKLRPDLVIVTPQTQQPRLLIHLYPVNQDLERPIAGRTWKASPATRMAELLRASGVRLGLVTNGERWMLVDAPRNETTGFASWYAALWLEEPLTLRSFRTLLRGYRFFSVPESETLDALLKESATNQQEVTDQLGYQVRRAVETLVLVLDRIDKDSGRKLLGKMAQTELYEASLTVMMRLVFLLSAEERGMLLLGEPLYDQYYAVSTLQARLREQADQQSEQVLEKFSDAWSRLLALFRLVYSGANHPDLRLPAYGGHLFDPDRYPFLEGRPAKTSWLDTPAESLPIDNRTVLHLLEALQYLQVRGPGGGRASAGREARRLSFRALDIEQIGHVYEGLLDHTAWRAPTAVLGLDGKAEPEILLTTLEEMRAKGEKAFLEFLAEETGRTAKALQKLWNVQPDIFQQSRLLIACDNDEALLQRVLPFAGLIRQDTFGNPVVITPGSVYVTQGSDRRSTGTHYTPRSLTEPIVQHALDPLVYAGPAEGKPEEDWRLHPAADLLNLKVCDMAMGSGAFLVQACRYLSEKLVQAWEDAEQHLLRLRAKALKGQDSDKILPPLQITPEGRESQGAPGEQLIPAEMDERLALARRLVAEHCLYGVDKNRMAVEMAKLSLWLITLDRGRPFTFLDHALRSGDSLLGVNLPQLMAWDMGVQAALAKGRGGRQTSWIEPLMKRALHTALELRHRINRLPVNADAKTNLEKEQLQKQAEAALELVRLGADLLVGTALVSDAERKSLLYSTLEMPYITLVTAVEQARLQPLTPLAKTELEQDQAELRTKVDQLLNKRTPYHWPLEFPEVFSDLKTGDTLDNPGFNGLIGNPPFQGGQKITGVLGTDYRDYLIEYLAKGKRGSADLCAYFFLRAGDIVKQGGDAALLATNTIAQGDSREVGLEQLVNAGWTIPRAVPSRRWPGTAALEVAHIWLRHGTWQSPFVLEEIPVVGITPFLTIPGTSEGKPCQLIANSNKSFQGSIVLGMGFVLEPEEAQTLIAKDPRNKEVLFPYLNGEDLNSRSDQLPSRWVINFFDWPLEKAETYSDCIAIVREKVKPERDKNNRAARRERWWQYAERATGLYNSITGMERVLVTAAVSPTTAFYMAHTKMVFAHKLIVFTIDKFAEFNFLQSTFHREWAYQYSSTLGGVTLNYSPSDVFETFPFPQNMERLENIGEQYYQHRQSIMLARQEGLTKTYNRFHDQKEKASDIVRLRELHREMDEAVALAYGWSDLQLEHGFHPTKQGQRYTISESARREVLGRLLKLNHERHAEELLSGQHEKKKGKKAKKTDTDTPQMF